MAVLRYTTLRLLVFAVTAALLWIVGLRGPWLLLFAILISGIASLFILNRSRDAMSVSLVERSDRIKQLRAQRLAAEDAWNEEQQRSPDERS